MSSRNAYLSPEERRAAVVLSRSLAEAESLVRGGERRAMTVLDRIRAAVAAEPLARLDYAEAVDPEILTPAATLRDGTLLALAVFIGRTRLIDNTVIQIP
jgi:pantoate--beta-alanine ligase